LRSFFKQGRDYRWPEVKRCPECHSSRIHSHGFVERYFEGFSRPLHMKRWRCRDCRAIHTARPSAYPPRFRHSKLTILNSLRHKIIHSRWVKGLQRQTQQYWYKWARRIASIRDNIQTLTSAIVERLMEGYFDYFNTPQIRAIEYEELLL